MLDQTNTSIREDFAASQINLDLLSYQKNPRVMPSSLRKLFEALKTIPPSSIESERTFSVTGFYITKFRCSLGDQSINALVFLKHIFQKEQQEKDKNFYISKLVPKIRPAKSTLRFSLILFLNRYSQVSIKRASLFNRDLRVDEVFLLQYECSMLPKFHSLF